VKDIYMLYNKWYERTIFYQWAQILTNFGRTFFEVYQPQD
jgi:hypothetical protein